jgi:hypothetical protein
MLRPIFFRVIRFRCTSRCSKAKGASVRPDAEVGEDHGHGEPLITFRNEGVIAGSANMALWATEQVAVGRCSSSAMSL